MKNFSERMAEYGKKILFKSIPDFFMKNVAEKKKKDSRGLVYIYGIRRYFAMLFDMVLVVLLLFFVNSGILFLVKDKATYIAVEKSNMDIKLTDEETLLKKRYMFWYLYVGQTLQTIMVILYVIVMLRRFSATPGKLAMGLRVVDVNTFDTISVNQALKRVISLPLSVAPLYIGLFWSRFDDRAQSWHDKIAGTVVVSAKSLKIFHESKSG